MRVTLIILTVLLGAHIGLTAMDSVRSMQDKRMAQFCKLDPTYCND